VRPFARGRLDIRIEICLCCFIESLGLVLQATAKDTLLEQFHGLTELEHAVKLLSLQHGLGVGISRAHS